MCVGLFVFCGILVRNDSAFYTLAQFRVPHSAVWWEQCLVNLNKEHGRLVIYKAALSLH